MMKKIKIIFFSALLLFSITQLPGQYLIGYFDHMDNGVENNCHSHGDDNCITSEPVIEEEPTLICNSGTEETVLLFKETHSVYDFELPVKLHYSIWLPPDVS